jgi:hypothetical protein
MLGKILMIKSGPLASLFMKKGYGQFGKEARRMVR